MEVLHAELLVAVAADAEDKMKCNATTLKGTNCPYNALIEGFCNIHYVQKMRKENRMPKRRSISVES